MEKRTKILLIVLASLVLLGGGSVVFMWMMAKKPVPVAAPPVPPRNMVKANPPVTPTNTGQPPVAAVKPAASPTAPAKPGPAPAPAVTAKPGQPPVAPVKPAVTPPAPAKPGPAPTPAVTAKPVQPPVAPVKPAATPAAPAKPGPAPVAAASVKPGQPAQAAATASVSQPFKLVEKGKTVEYKSADDLVARTTLTLDEVKAYCGSGLAEAKKALEAAQAKKDKVATARAEEAVKAFETLATLVDAKLAQKPKAGEFAYSSLGKRDPFMNPLEVPKVFPPIPANARPLERVAVQQLQVKAILWTDKGYRALIVSSDGRGYTVRQGDPIGDKRGKVSKITESKVYVTEKIADILGDVETKNIVLKLYKED